MTVHEFCNDAIRYKELLLVDIIQMLIDKQVLSWTDPIDKLEQLLTPPEGHYEAWNERYKQVLRERKSA